MSTTELNVIFGVGPLGMAVAEELVSRGKRVRMVSRTGSLQVPAGVEVVRGNAVHPSTTADHCKGAAAIFHCANPPYAKWYTEFPPLQKGILDAAIASGAKLIFGDNLYSYGPVAGPLKEDLPANATGPNGRTRAEMVRVLLQAHNAGKVRVAVGRASDFFGPRVLTSHAGERLFGPAVLGKPAQLLSMPDNPHTYTFIRDFARGLVVLSQNERALGEVWHIPSGETLTTRRFIELVYREAGTEPRFSVAPRPIVSLMAMAMPVMRAVKEQLYQFDRPFIMDHSKFVSAFGDISTPHERAIRETVDWYRKRLK